MQQALDSNTLDRLITLGRKQGHLTNRDLESHLPIASMSEEEIALIVVQLEESGVPVELEDSLTAPNAKPSAPPQKSAEIIPFPDRSAAARMKKRTAPVQKSAPAKTEAPRIAKQESRAAHWAVAAAGLLVLALMVGLLMQFGI
jgi:Sigma-70 factor, region 1.1